MKKRFCTILAAMFATTSMACTIQVQALAAGEFQPMLEGIEPALPGKKVVLFGSYDWGVGEWLSNWEARCAEKGITLAAESVKANNTPDDEALSACKALGKAIV